jgi:Tfp pilus assembly protein PilP
VLEKKKMKKIQLLVLLIFISSCSSEKFLPLQEYIAANKEVREKNPNLFNTVIFQRCSALYKFSAFSMEEEIKITKINRYKSMVKNFNYKAEAAQKISASFLVLSGEKQDKADKIVLKKINSYSDQYKSDAKKHYKKINKRDLKGSYIINDLEVCRKMMNVMRK